MHFAGFASLSDDIPQDIGTNQISAQSIRCFLAWSFQYVVLLPQLSNALLVSIAIISVLCSCVRFLELRCTTVGRLELFIMFNNREELFELIFVQCLTFKTTRHKM